MTKLFVWIPVAVFFFVFLFYHMLVCDRCAARMWLDKLCIHQTNLDIMGSGVSALPEFVHKSTRMLVLWSENYFERLWCNAELATFIATHDGVDGIDIVPLWLAPWILTTIIMDLISASLSTYFYFLAPILISKLECLGQAGSIIVGNTFAIGIVFGLGYIPSVIPNWFLFRTKADMHELLQKQVSSFSFADAKCSVESDRAIVHNLVSQLYAEHGRCPIQAFDRHINTVLRDDMRTQIGSATQITYRQSLIVFMPLAFSALVNVLYCDGMPCSKTAAVELSPASTAYEWALVDIGYWLVATFLVYPTTYPVMMQLLHLCRTYLHNCCCMYVVASILSIMLSYFYMGCLSGFVVGVIFYYPTQGFSGWSVIVILVLVLAAWNRFLFGRSSTTTVPQHGEQE
mmetsp:Transcript_61400/g.95323  ORF Transcript_61400/g.95323 Transcript_61400/m.95323 type:complete len:401 (+) Transcript_61400:2-1204(+)